MTGLGTPVTTTVPLFDFLPGQSYRRPEDPTAPPCPTTCAELGAEIYPAGFRAVLREAGAYHLPVYVTENGLADGDDDQRAGYLVEHLRVLRGVMRDRLARVRGYFAWSLMDNFEWSSGYQPRFGFFTLGRAERPSASVFRRIARFGVLPAGH